MVPDSEAVLTAAHDYARRGWRVVPLHGILEDGMGTAACTCRAGASCNSAGKHPVEARWQATPPMSGADVQATFEDGTRNIGLATGDSFWVLDIDLDKPGTKERLEALQAGRKLPPTRIVRTPGGGYHYYFAMPDFRVTNSAKRLPDGVDVRGAGGQVVAPPSVSHKGVYTVVVDTEPAAAPDWLLDLVRPLPATPPAELADLPKLEDLPEGEQKRLRAYTDSIRTKEYARLVECAKLGWQGPPWNITTFEVACTLIELANSPWCPMTRQEAHDELLRNAPRDEQFGEQEIEDRFTSALRTVGDKPRAYPEDRKPKLTVYPGDPLSDPTAGGGSATAGGTTPSSGEPAPQLILRAWNDLGNARRMVDLYGERLRWVKEADDWAVYEAGAWRLAGASAGRALAQEMVEGLVDREAHLYNDDPTGPNGDKPSEREQFVKWAHGQQMTSKISACLKECTGRPELQVAMTDFDSHEDLINVANGVVSLRTGELLDHDPELLMMLQSPVAYHPDAAAPRWDKFLERCLPEQEVRDYLQSAFGYSLTGSMAEQALFIHHGPGANGKSVFLIIASHIAGGYGQVVPRETLLARSGSGSEHPTSVARMRGKRFLQASETAAGRRLDEETVKGLTGGEQQTARFMGADFFDFTPTGKIHFVTNHLPRLTDAESIWRRLHLIGWRETIPVSERDPRLAQKIIAEESEGVLAWAIRGAVRWYRDRLQVPISMQQDLFEYRSDQDVLGEFIVARLEADEHAFTATSDIYGAYSAWCFQSGIKTPMTSQDLARALRERKFETHRTGRHRGFRARIIPVNITVDPLMSV